jgi:AraC-like DNA-binding protein
MRSEDTLKRLRYLMDLIFRRSYPQAVHLTAETGFPPDGGRLTLMDCPRLSICLSASARYLVRHNGLLGSVALSRGEVVFVAPNCAMDPHPKGSYLSLGIVFHPQLTRFLLAKKLPSSPGSFNLLTHYCSTTLDQDGWNLCRALGNSRNLPPKDPYMVSLMQALLRKTSHLLDEANSNTLHGKAYFTWQAACQFVKEHMQQPLSRRDVAQFLNLHPNHISRLFAQFGGESFHHYILQARLDRACELLKNPTLNIGEIANSCGFSDANYFIRCFRKKYGQPPGRTRGSQE